MATTEEITNKLISIDTIVTIANYFENEKKHYEKLYEYNRLLNENKKYDEKQYIYKKNTNSVSYSLEFFSGEKTAKDDYDWFIQKLNTVDISTVKDITIYFYTGYSEGASPLEFTHKRIENYIAFKQDNVERHSVYISFKNDTMEEENFKIHNDIMAILNQCPPRYDKTIKYKFFRMQSLNLSIGFIFGYIVLIALYFFKGQIPANIHDILFSYKYVLVIIFLATSAIFGNIIGQFFNNALYKNIVPKKKYSHYSSKQRQAVYTDNVEDYVKYVEIQIGIFHNSIEKRKKIENIFKKTLPIVLLHIVVCVVICLI